MIRILIVDDQKSIREQLKGILQTEADFKIVGAAEDGYDALKKAQKTQPDVMLVDLEMPLLDGIALTRIIQKDFTRIKIIVLSTHNEDEYVNQSLQAGAMGYFLKETPPYELKEAIRFVHRGYAQFGPGLLHKVIPVVPSQPVKPESIPSQNYPHNWDIESLSSAQFEELMTSSHNPSRSRQSWKPYFFYWLGGNILLSILAIIYLMLKNPTYTSKWVLSLPANKNHNSLSIPSIGSVTSNTDSPYHNNIFDPRENYKFLLRSKETITQAAMQLGMNRSEFGKPEVEIVDNTTMMALSIEGATALEARRKAFILQKVLEKKLVELRQNHINQTDNSLQENLKKSQQNLQLAREKVSTYKANSQLGSSNKVHNLSSNLENLRRQKVEINAQLHQTRSQAEQLTNNLGMAPQSAKDAFILHADFLFQKYLGEYTRLSSELIGIESKFHLNNPLTIHKQEETQAAQVALLKRGEILLGKKLPPELLQQLSLRTENEDESYRGSLLQDIVSLQSTTRGLEAQIQELDRHIALLDTQENTLVRQGSALNILEQEVKFAETVYSANLAKLKLSQSNLYDAYPQIQVAIQPNLPANPSEPNPKLVFLGTFMSSCLLTTAIASIWANSTEKKPMELSNNNHQAIASNSNHIVKK